MKLAVVFIFMYVTIKDEKFIYGVFYHVRKQNKRYQR